MEVKKEEGYSRKQLLVDIINYQKHNNFQRVYKNMRSRLTRICDYPFWNEKTKCAFYNYADKEELMAIINLGFYEAISSFGVQLKDDKVAWKEMLKYSVNKNLNYLAKRTRFYCQYQINVYFKELNRTHNTIYLDGLFEVNEYVSLSGVSNRDMQFLPTNNDVEGWIIRKNTEEILSSKIRDFVNLQSPENRVIFKAMLYKKFCSANNLNTERKIADSVGLSTRTVFRRRLKMIDSFKIYWQQEIEPSIVLME